MGVSGERFLELTRAKRLQISKHALSRLQERTGWRLSEEKSFELFLDSRQLRVDEMITLGYRPAYGSRLSKGERSWYFRLLVGGEEAVAVIGQAVAEGEYVWMTTYARSSQTEQLCTATYDKLACVA